MYFNTLIIMNEDATGYGNRSRKPSGYCKLTMPNRIICYVQGLRQLPKDETYKLYLISKTRQRSIEAGKFQVGLNGSKETRWMMDPSNINNSGISAKEVDGAIIVVDGKDHEKRIVPLTGFSADPYDWESLIETHRAENPQPKQAVEPEPKPAPKPEPEVEAPKPEIEPKVEELARIAPSQEQEEIVALKEEIKQLNDTIKQSRAIIINLQADMKEEKPRSAKPEAKTEPKLEPESVEKTGINEYVNNFIRRFQTDNQGNNKEEDKHDRSEMQSMFEKRIPINPFEAQNTGIKWVRITYGDLDTLSSLDREWKHQPLLMNADRDYKHFILGRGQSGQGYYLGIPGVFDPSEGSPLEIDKIERFSCCHDIPPKVGAVGYWIAQV